MLIKIYWSIWGFFAFTAVVLIATGNLTMMSLVVMGFVAFGHTFMGMMGVLPTMVGQPIAAKPAKVRQHVAMESVSQAPANGFHIFKSA